MVAQRTGSFTASRSRAFRKPPWLRQFSTTLISTPTGITAERRFNSCSYSSITAYREDSVGLVASGWYEQANPTLRYTIGRDGFIVVMWRHSPPHHPTATSIVSDFDGRPTAVDLDSFAGIKSTMTTDSDGSGTSSFTNYIGPTSSATESGTITWTAAK